MSSAVILCEPRTDCTDPHLYRWHCMRRKGVCPLTVCERRGANRQAQPKETPQ